MNFAIQIANISNGVYPVILTNVENIAYHC